jgi:hypothetical protein
MEEAKTLDFNIVTITAIKNQILVGSSLINWLDPALLKLILNAG